jgi:hypothetical protein
MLAFAAAGLGVAVVNGICRPTWDAVLCPIPELGSVTYRLLLRRDVPRSKALERLVSLVLEEATRPPPACPPEAVSVPLSLSWRAMAPVPSLTIDDSLWPLRRVTCVGTVSTQRFEDYLNNTVDRLREGHRFVAILDITQGGAPNTEQRQRQARWFREHETLLREVHLGVAFIVTSPLLRLALSTIFYFKPMPTPYLVTSDDSQATRWASSRLQEAGLALDAERLRHHAS